MLEPARLLSAFRIALTGHDVALGWCVPGQAPIDALSPSERRGVADRRLPEVAAGRAAARAALCRAGRAAVPIGRDAAGAPLWPEGVVGSITHTDELALAAVGASEDIDAIGIDLERTRALGPAALEHITTAAELARVRAAPDPRQEAIALFCAKEAFYKAQYPKSGRVLGFDAVEIHFGPQARTPRPFVARLCCDAPPLLRGAELPGTVVHAESHVVAAVVISARGPTSRAW